MSNIDKQAYRADGGDIGTGRIKEIADNVYGDEEKAWLAKRVLVLLDELEAKEEQRANWFQMAQKLGDDLDAAERRIAELEAREVNLHKRSVGEVMHMSGFSRDYAEGWCSGNDNAIHEIHAAGLKVAAAGKGETS